MTDLLDRISIASPCSANWNDMQGDDRRRFCASCRLHVHDLSAMTRDDAEALLRAAGQGRVCVRLFRRADGRVLTRDCPVGLRQKLRAAWARAAALWLCLWGASACAKPQPATGAPLPANAHAMGEAVMGDVAAPAQAPAGAPGAATPTTAVPANGPVPEMGKFAVPQPPKK
jgi:hypothetical protein